MSHLTGLLKSKTTTFVLLLGCGAACLAQVWLSLHTMRGEVIWKHCDFPDTCLDQYYPRVYGRIVALWIIGATVAWALMVASAVSGARRWGLVRVGVVAVMMSLWFFMTPIPWYETGLMANYQPAEMDTRYELGLAMLMLAAAVVAWELIARFRLMRTPDVPREKPVLASSSNQNGP